MKNNSNVMGKAWGFIKRNAAYLILVLCLLAVGLSVTLVLLKDSKSFVDVNQESKDVSDIIDDDKSKEDEDKVTFQMPVAVFTSVESYSDTMVFNSTLNRYSAHLGIDFFAEEGTDVLCVSQGVVESIDNSLLTGITVIVNHGNGLTSVYNSLGEADEIAVGQELKAGDKIGTVSVTNRQEYKEGAHLHFEMRENGVNVDPEKYLTFNNK